MGIDSSTWILIGVIAAVMIFRSIGASQRARRDPLYCPQCGAVAKAQAATRGSRGIELLLWLCFIIPGLIYTLWRANSKYQVCPSCGSAGLIPVTSPRAQADLAARSHS
jgi:hypothetical protein